MSFEYLDHTADVAVRLRASDAVELFRAATAAWQAILLDTEKGQAVRKAAAVPVRIEAEDGEALLIDYLNEMIFLFDSRRFLTADLQVSELRLESPAVLAGELQGETFDPARHAAKTEIKAATFHDLEIRRTDSGLEADVVFDL